MNSERRSSSDVEGSDTIATYCWVNPTISLTKTTKLTPTDIQLNRAQEELQEKWQRSTTQTGERTISAENKNKRYRSAAPAGLERSKAGYMYEVGRQVMRRQQHGSRRRERPIRTAATTIITAPTTTTTTAYIKHEFTCRSNSMRAKLFVLPTSSWKL